MCQYLRDMVLYLYIRKQKQFPKWREKLIKIKTGMMQKLSVESKFSRQIFSTEAVFRIALGTPGLSIDS